MRRTTATTDYLKECMGTALLELMKEKPIEKISIEEMTAKADVGRSTYFRYFKSKDEVLSFKITCLWKRFSDEHGATNFATGSYDGIRLFFEFCLSARPICDLLYSADRQYVILNFYSHRPNISPVISGYKQPSKSAQSIEITGFIEKSKPPKIIFLYTLLPLTA